MPQITGQIQIPYPDARAWEGQWGFRIGRNSATTMSLTVAGPHSVSALSGSGGGVISASQVFPLFDTSAQNAMDVAGLSTGALVNASVSTLFHVYYCGAGDFQGGLGFSTTAPTRVNGLYVLANSDVGNTCIFVGWMRTDAAGNMQDNAAQRLVVNYYNRRWVSLLLRPAYADGNSTTTYALTTATWTRINAGTGDTGEWISNGEEAIRASATFVLGAVAPASIIKCGIGDNSNTQPLVCASLGSLAISGSSMSCQAVISAAAGYRTITMLAVTGNLATTFAADYLRDGAASDPPATYLYASIPT